MKITFSQKLTLKHNNEFPEFRKHMNSRKKMEVALNSLSEWFCPVGDIHSFLALYIALSDVELDPFLQVP